MVENKGEYRSAVSFQIAKCNTVIAVQCRDTGGSAGILISDDHGLITDSLWHCTRTWQHGWEQPHFIENADIWRNADAHGTNGGNSPFPHIPGINNSAYWIWLGHYSRDAGGTVYCRRSL